MLRRLPLLFLIGALSALSFAACGGDDDEPDIPDEISVSDELPADWPDDFPIYSPAEVEDVITSTEQGAEGTVATYQTNDAVADVIAFYEGEFEAGPWVNTVEPELQGDNASFLVEHDGGSYTGSSVTVAQEDGNTAIVILVTAE